ncbi:hypothetical protein CKM354_000245900 [Cercospora kikuchii]|uniref:Uncharacterized protein n=1 Tax=Cercospora kikuchii TaxID=84275 RepID=A0A9P3CCX6_9PEZI|nr:uncharacterized protein CKM354_000245900 [Cercospora kikuchii]GIZ39067.1 hypothetical protein CKM354_000245900 [Cercospora kikuchii]
MALPRPSNGVSARPHRGSGLRHELKQRNLPGAARPDPYDLPESPDKTIKLRRPAVEASNLSPLRKQKATRHLDQGEANMTSTDGQDATNPHEPIGQMLRSSSRRAIAANMQLSQPSSGSAKRHASPVVVSNAANQDPGALSVYLDEADVLDEEHHVPDTSASPKSQAPRKRGRPSKSEANDRPSKIAKQAQSPHDPTLPSRRRSSRLGANVSVLEAATKGTPLIKPVSLRVSEIPFPANGQGQQPEFEDSTILEGEVAAAAVKPPKQVKRVLKAKKPKPAPVQQREKSPVQTKDDASDDEAEPPGNDAGEESILEKEADIRLLGHHESLKAVFKRAKLVEKCGELESMDKEIRKMQRFCLEFVKALNEHRDRPEDVELLSDPPEQFQTIASDIRMLCSKDPARPVNLKSALKSHNIYLRLMPALIRILFALVECYQAVDADTAPFERSVTIKHLETITKFIAMFLELNTGAKQFIRPDTQLTAVQPFDRSIVPPLKSMQETFRRHIKDHEEHQISLALNRREKLRLEAEERAEAEEKAEKTKWEKLETKWTRLHEERYRSDEPIKTVAKRAHLRQPTSSFPEEDHNGHPFERLEVFRPRVGPPPALIEKAKQQSWPEESYAALMKGLQMWSGDVLIFERIFRMFCGRNGALNGFNVTEIVVMAALIREHLEKTVDVDGEREWWWVKGIPDWTRVHTVLEMLEGSGGGDGEG